MRGIAKFLAAALLVLPLVVAVGTDETAAGSTQTGTIRGRVVDEKNEPLVGVTAILRSPSLIREQARLTDAEGNFFAAGLPAGNYTVVFQLTGYTTVQLETTVGADKTTVLPVKMISGEVTETVTVTATRPVVERTQTEKSVQLDKTFTENIPAVRQYQSLIQYAPGVVGGANPNILGGTANSNQYLVDGVSARDPVTGTFGLNLFYDAIESVDVKLTGVSAEYGQFQGGLTNIITKSGGNEFTGSVRDVLTAPKWTKLYSPSSQDNFAPATSFYNRPARTTTYPVNADKKNDQVGITLGGPAIQDRLWFFLGYEQTKTVAVNSLFNNPTGGVDGNGTWVRLFDGNSTVAKLTWQATNNHRFQYQYSEDPAAVPVAYFWTPYDSWNLTLQKQGGYLWVGNWSATWGPSVQSEARVTKFRNGFDVNPFTPIPQDLPADLPRSRTNEISPFVWAPFTILDANYFKDVEARPRDQYEAAVTWFADTESLGTHTLKIGADYIEQFREGAAAIQGNALFYGVWNDTTQSPYQLSNRTYYSWYDFELPGSAIPTNTLSAIYVNDSWDLNPNWSFNLGLRYEKSDNQNDVGESIIKDSGFAPRLGVSWDPTGQGKHVVKATAARYLAGINLGTVTSFVRNAGGASAYNVWFNVNTDEEGNVLPGAPDWELGFVVSPDPSTARFAAGITPQAIDEYSLGYEFLVSPTFGLGIKGVQRTWNDIVTQTFSYDYSTGAPVQIFEINNNEDAEREYTAAILTAEKRFADNWELKSNYTWSQTKGNVTTEDGFDTYAAYPGVPQAVNNRYGLLPWDVKHAFKAQAFYTVPINSSRHGLVLGGVFDYRSGNPFARTQSPTPTVVVGPGPNGVVDSTCAAYAGGLGCPRTAGTDDQTASVVNFVDPRGSSGRAPNVWTLDLSTNYRFRFSGNVNFETRFEVFNVTNEQKATAVSSNWVVGGSATNATNHVFGYPTSYAQLQRPRRYQIQFALTW